MLAPSTTAAPAPALACPFMCSELMGMRDEVSELTRQGRPFLYSYNGRTLFTSSMI